MAFDKGASWDRYREQYIGHANAATGETINQTGLTSGGYGASYAGNAASMAQDNYLSKLYNQFSSIYGTTDKSKQTGPLNTDSLWQNYADQYVRGGRQSMRDTLGQYEARTGGYGNSLATGAAASAYYKYLDELNAKWPTEKPSTGGGRAKPKTPEIVGTPMELPNLIDIYTDDVGKGTIENTQRQIHSQEPWLYDRGDYDPNKGLQVYGGTGQTDLTFKAPTGWNAPGYSGVKNNPGKRPINPKKEPTKK